jgi:hypothetical protein
MVDWHAGVSPADVTAPGSWSPLEHVRHVAMELHVQAERIARIIAHDEPIVDLIVGTLHVPRNREPVDGALSALVVSADRLCDLIAGVRERDWSRRGHRKEKMVTVDQLMSEAGHEVLHHLREIGQPTCRTDQRLRPAALHSY